MAIVKSRVVHVKKGSGDKCEWETFYRGDEVPSEWLNNFLQQGGELEATTDLPGEPVHENYTSGEDVSPDSIPAEEDWLEFDKDKLESWTKEKFGIDLDKRKSLRSLQTIVQKLLDA